MEIEGESLARLYDLVMFPPGGQDGDGQRIIDSIESIGDGTWLQRWHVRRDLAAPVLGSVQYVVSLREGLVFRVVCNYSGQPDVMAIHLLEARADPRPGETPPPPISST